jgi:hypothetical protein
VQRTCRGHARLQQRQQAVYLTMEKGLAHKRVLTDKFTHVSNCTVHTPDLGLQCKQQDAAGSC